jgi:hypothetical protein
MRILQIQKLIDRFRADQVGNVTMLHALSLLDQQPLGQVMRPGQTILIIS